MRRTNVPPVGRGRAFRRSPRIRIKERRTLRGGVLSERGSRTRWQQLGGHITTLNPTTNGASRIPSNEFEFFETVPSSLGNYRLIAANWLSSNALSYGLAVSVLAVALGLATAGLLSAFGRRE
jgi:hypothetical protein